MKLLKSIGLQFRRNRTNKQIHLKKIIHLEPLNCIGYYGYRLYWYRPKINGQNNGKYLQNTRYRPNIGQNENVGIGGQYTGWENISVSAGPISVQPYFNHMTSTICHTFIFIPVGYKLACMLNFSFLFG
jgi:hypothetical protein